MTTALLATSVSATWQVSPLRLFTFGAAFAFLLILTLVVSMAAKDRPSAATLASDLRDPAYRPSTRRFLTQLMEGHDGRLSTSKCQALVWTFVAIFGFVEVFIERTMLGISTSDQSIPINLLIAIGFSVTTMTAAKGITVSYAGSGLLNKATPTDPGKLKDGRPRFGGLVTDDDGAPDLSKIQMLAFTMIAVLVYILRMTLQDKGPPELADIEPALMVLMGLSQGAYIGKKLTTTETPRVAGMSPGTGKGGDPIKLTGVSFGDEQNGSVISVEGMPVPEVIAWSDKEITFKFPTERAAAIAWKDGDRASILVSANGRDAPSPFQFVFRDPPPPSSPPVDGSTPNLPK